jgi:hypothetical protein
MDLRERSHQAVGNIWTEADHIYLVGHLDKIDRLVQDLHNRRDVRATEANRITEADFRKAQAEHREKKAREAIAEPNNLTT